MKKPVAPIGFAITFAVVAGLATFYMQVSLVYIAVGCVVAGIGGAACGYLLSDKK